MKVLGTKYHTEDLYRLLWSDYDMRLSDYLTTVNTPTCQSSTHNHNFSSHGNWVSLVDCPAAPTPCAPVAKYATKKPQKENSTMAYNNGYATPVSLNLDIQQAQPAVSLESKALSHLTDRLQSIKYTKRNELAKTFNIYGPTQPESYQQLIDAIKAGEYTIDPKVQKRFELSQMDSDSDYDDDGDEDFKSFNSSYDTWGYGPLHGIKFTKLPNAPDSKGYDAALKALDKEYTRTMDTIKVMPATEGLDALRAFEDWQPTGTAN